MGGRVRSLWRIFTRRQNFEEGMSEELRFHIEQYTDDLVRSGVSKAEASRRARLEFGSLNSVTEECREARGLRLFDELRRELSYTIRLLRKTPGFTATALLTLAVCIGANLTIFAVIDSVLLRPLPFPAPDRLVTVFNTYPKAGVDRDGSSVTNYYERRGQIRAFSSLSIYYFGSAVVGDVGSTERESITRVSPEFFSTLGSGPVIGRAFTEGETTYKTDNAVILTDAYWRQRFQADPHVLGRQLRVDGQPRFVVGVLPAGFRFLSSDARLYFPLASSPDRRAPSQRHSGGNVIQMIARLRPDASLSQAQSQIDAQNAALEMAALEMAALEMEAPQAKMMADAGFRSLVTPLRQDHVAAIRPILLLLQASVLLLLLIGTVNLINLFLVRANGRVREVGVRQALGASRRHIVSEIMVETTSIAFAGGLLGLLVAAGGIRLLAAIGADQLPLGAQIAIDARVGLAALAGTIVMGIVLAGPIAWFNLRGHPAAAIHSETRGGTANSAAQRLRHGFIAAQIALAFILLSGAGLLGLSLQRAMAVSPGFRPDHVLTGRISLPGAKYSSADARFAFSETLLRELDRQPGVVASGIASNVPLSGHSGKSAAAVKGHVVRPGESPRGHYSYQVGGDYFEAMGFVLREGRLLTAADSSRAARVCVVDDDFARYYWPDSSALGQRLFQGSVEGNDADAFTVVGVVAGAKQAGLTEDTAQGAIYYPNAARNDRDMFVAARTGYPPDSLALTLQRLVRQIDPDLPVTDIRSMETRIANSLVDRRSPAVMAGLFAGIALLLTAIGSYGVLSYAVSQRRREIGLRMALGARPEQIRRQFFFVALRLLVYGSIAGVIGAWLAGRGVEAVLYHVPAFNVPILASAAGVMTLICIVACLLPAYRAARTSPREVLNEQ